jgi:cholinesterase
LNYRLVIFGFPSGVEGVDTNVGLRDQRLAVEWVRDNIEKFGGDPNRIMIFGQSAGAFSVDNYAFAWAKEKDPIIKGIIAQSGSAYTSRTSNATRSLAAWQSTAKALGCSTTGKDSLDCVRGKPWVDVLNAMRGGPSLANGAMR